MYHNKKNSKKGENLRDELHDIALCGLSTGRQQLFVTVQSFHAYESMIQL